MEISNTEHSYQSIELALCLKFILIQRHYLVRKQYDDDSDTM